MSEIIQFPSSEVRTEEPAGELRWHNGVLQMLWSETIFNDGHPVRGGVFWRDVPKVLENHVEDSGQEQSAPRSSLTMEI